MRSRTSLWTARIAAVLILAAGTTVALAQAPTPNHFSGLINDYTPAHGATGSLTGPYEMHGTWSLDLDRRSGMAQFSAAMTMELSDLTVSEGLTNADDPVTRGAHTHHITMKGLVSYDTSGCPAEPVGNPSTTGRFVVNGPAYITGNGSPAPFSKNQTVLSSLQVCVTGGTEVAYSNVTLVLGAPATGHFGMQPIHGVVRKTSDFPFVDIRR
ncbi:MAG TPA: hypothetical protein VMH00_07505 [Candidatus Limnocylindrales bacterium]|nr:hypothetical protein [Candidatus Limnocylindrales bacterium]